LAFTIKSSKHHDDGCYLGGQAARRSMEIKAEREDRKRLRHTLDVKNDVINAVRSSHDTTVGAQLAADWMRD
jgi:hypothetical protein